MYRVIVLKVLPTCIRTFRCRIIQVLHGASLVAASASADPVPLPSTTGDRTFTEYTAPFLIPEHFTQTFLTDRETLNLQGLPISFRKWDMVSFGPNSRYIFVPAEVNLKSGVFRYDTWTGSFVTIMLGIGGGTDARTSDPDLFDPTMDEYFKLDPTTPTPWGTIITAEEASGGRLFEILDPLDLPAPSEFDVRWRSNIPSVRHEGLRFDSGGTLYFVDESNSGSLYKFVPSQANNLEVGQSFVLSVDAFADNPGTDASATWDSATNAPYDQDRFGAATWVPITDTNGIALTTADPFAFVTATGGRTAADEVGGTPYGRPEDICIGTLANGNEVVYCALTNENRVVPIELTGSTTAFVREFVNFDTINEYTGIDVNTTQNDPYTAPDTSTSFGKPDNLAIGPSGKVYIVEDDAPGDIWKAIDADKDGVAESIALWASLGVDGTEPSGLIVDPNNPNRFLVCVQHPTSLNEALWPVTPLGRFRPRQHRTRHPDPPLQYRHRRHLQHSGRRDRNLQLQHHQKR